MSKVRIEFLSWLADTLGVEGKSEEIVLEAMIEGSNTVRELLSRLAAKYPRFGQIVFNVEDLKLTEKVSLFLNGHHLELLNGLETKLNDGDILSFVPPIAGGQARPRVVVVTVVELGGWGQVTLNGALKGEDLALHRQTEIRGGRLRYWGRISFTIRLVEKLPRELKELERLSPCLDGQDEEQLAKIYL